MSVMRSLPRRLLGAKASSRQVLAMTSKQLVRCDVKYGDDETPVRGRCRGSVHDVGEPHQLAAEPVDLREPQGYGVGQLAEQATAAAGDVREEDHPELVDEPLLE